MPYWRALRYMGTSVMSSSSIRTRPVSGGDKANDGVEGCGLAGAVRSKQTNDFALLDAQADPVYNPAAAIRFADFIGG